MLRKTLFLGMAYIQINFVYKSIDKQNQYFLQLKHLNFDFSSNLWKAPLLSKYHHGHETQY